MFASSHSIDYARLGFLFFDNVRYEVEAVNKKPKANPNIQNEMGDTPVSLVITHAKDSNKSVNALRHLFQYGADPFKKDSTGQDTLTKACQLNSKVQELIIAETLSHINNPMKNT